ncbi:MAG: 50S ribosomal protein L6 [Chlorobi bacterium]|nr:50S ribosomal protein L6 [Chlorobiota bacterium]MCI0714904.1 50S ribosomal protein L6 [Chlorobiota bacterium]
MSRIGKKPVKILKGVKVEKKGDNIFVTGPKGSLEVYLNPVIKTQIKDEEIEFTRDSDLKRDKALHGLYAILVKNMISGVTEGFSKKLELVGIGYRAEMKQNKLFLNLGFSHPIIFNPPEGIKIDLPTDTTIVISGIDKQLIGLVAAKIRSFKLPEPYKGKGIKYEGEYIRRKAGKAAAK